MSDRTLRRAGLAACALLLAACATAPTPTPAAPAVAVGGLPDAGGRDWELVDRDDFQGSRLDQTRWEVYDHPASNGVGDWFPEQVSVAGGQLRITGRGRDPSGVGNRAGGLCWCGRHGDQTYGLWRLRARLEPGAGYGQVFLLWPASGRWPQDGELNFAEVPGGAKDEVVGVVHWGDPPRGEEDSARLRADLTAWHTYTVVWLPGVVRYYLDDTLFYDSTTSGGQVEVPDGPMHLALQVEPGPFGRDWVPAPGPDTPDEVVTHVDWVELHRWVPSDRRGQPQQGEGDERRGEDGDQRPQQADGPDRDGIGGDPDQGVHEQEQDQGRHQPGQRGLAQDPRGRLEHG